MTPSLEERYDRTLGIQERYSGSVYDTRESYAVGIVVRPLRLFAAGDVVIEHIANGQGERWMFNGWSSKRRAAIHGFYLQYARWGPSRSDRREYREVCALYPNDRDIIFETRSLFHENRSPVRLFTRPEEFRKASWTLPGLRERALSALRAAYPAFPVSTNSGAHPSRPTTHPLPRDSPNG